MLKIVVACAAMFAKDSINIVLMLAQTRGNARLAAVLAGASDLAGFLVTIYGVGGVIQHGWTTYYVVTMACLMVTSSFGSYLWTRIGERIVGGDKHVDDIDARVRRLELLSPHVRTSEKAE